jgi:hypothetical protein
MAANFELPDRLRGTVKSASNRDNPDSLQRFSGGVAGLLHMQSDASGAQAYWTLT